MAKTPIKMRLKLELSEDPVNYKYKNSIYFKDFSSKENS
jgi:hypothetical protein